MAKGAALSAGSGGENIQHFSTIRIRATGQGNLNIVVYSLDYVKAKPLAPLKLNAASRIIPNRLVNFVEQRASFEMSAVEFNDYFRINRIVVFMKEIYTSHPAA